MAIFVTAGILRRTSFSHLASEHMKWEMSLTVVTAILYLPMLLWNLFTIPAKMDAEASQQIEQLKPRPSPTESRRRASVKDKINKFTSSEHDIISDILSHGSCQWFVAGMDRPDPWSNLENIGLVIKERGGRCVLRPEVEADVKAIFDEEFRRQEESGGTTSAS